MKGDKEQFINEAEQKAKNYEALSKFYALVFKPTVQEFHGKPLNNRFVLLLPAEGITSVTSVAVPSQQAEQLYDLQGRQLKGESTTKGFYIKNGKKYIHY